MTKASDNAFPSLLITEGTEPSAPAAGKQRLYIDSTSHHLKRTDSSGTDTDIETAAAGGLVAYDINTYTAGNITNSGTTPTAVSGPTDLVVAAAAGDLLVVGISALVNNTTNVSIGFDFATIVSAAPVNYLSSATGTPITIGVLQWFCFLSVAAKVGGSYPYVVQAGDLSGGNVTLRLYARVSSGSRVLDATATSPLVTWTANLGT